MRVVALSLAVLVTGILSAAPARAEFLVGLTADNELVGINLEVAGRLGSAYAVLGAYQSATGYEVANLTGIVGVRRFFSEAHDVNGYFGGIYAGDIAGGFNYNRFGVGGELGHQWLTDHLRMTLHAGMGLVGEGTGEGAPPDTEIKPTPLFGASISLRF